MRGRGARLRQWLAEQRSCRWVKRLLKGPEVSQERIAEFLARHEGRPLPVRDPAKEPSLALVVPCYNHAGYLRQMFASIVAQTRRPAEVILVDDQATDGTGELLEKLVSEHRKSFPARLTVLHNEQNLGQAASLNRGIAAASSEQIMVLNDDDYLLPFAVSLVGALFERHPDLFMIGSTSVHFSSDREIAEVLERWKGRDPRAEARLSRREPGAVRSYVYYNDLNMTNSGCSFLKTAWETVGGYFPQKERRLVPFSDRDFQLRVNALLPVGVSLEVPFAMWRSNSSVDCGINS